MTAHYRALDVAPQVPNSGSLSHFPASTISDIIPHLRKLRQINLRNILIEQPLLTILISSPVSTVFIGSDLGYKSLFATAGIMDLPKLDLEKIILIQDVALNMPRLNNLVTSGMQVRHLYVDLELLDTWTIPGLCKLTVQQSDDILFKVASQVCTLASIIENRVQKCGSVWFLGLI